MNSTATKAAGHRINPQKLLLSKWTAVTPQNREKHFIVNELFCDEEGKVLEISLQAVHSQRCQQLNWRELKNRDAWLIGWQ